MMGIKFDGKTLIVVQWEPDAGGYWKRIVDVIDHVGKDAEVIEYAIPPLQSTEGIKPL